MTLKLQSDDLLPIVTQTEFDQITCNQCGDCCERYYQPRPLQIIFYYINCDIVGWVIPKLQKQFTDEQLIKAGWKSWLNPNSLDARRKWKWFSNMSPIGIEFTEEEAGDNRYQYSCAAFKRLNENEGICTIWEDRPEICRGFPYGKPASSEFSRCSWRVKIKG